MQRATKQRKVHWVEGGFTLIELLISLFIISVISALAMPHMRGAGERAQETACESNQRLIRQELENYYLSHHAYPTGSSDEILNALVQQKYLQSKPAEPSGGSYQITIAEDGSSATVSCTKHGELGK